MGWKVQKGVAGKAKGSPRPTSWQTISHHRDKATAQKEATQLRSHMRAKGYRLRVVQD